MKRLIIILVISILVVGLNALAQDMSISSDGNVGIGTPNPTARLEVIAGPDSDGVAGYGNGSGMGIYGESSTSGDFGVLGYLGYGVYGYSGSGYAGYFQGNARVTGNLTVDGFLTGPGIADITEIVPGNGLTGGGTSGSVTIDVNFNGTGSADTVARSDHDHNASYSLMGHSHSGTDINSGVLSEGLIDPLIARDAEIMPKVLSLDGSGSGLDADMLDGQDSSSFAATENVNILEARVTSLEGQMADIPDSLVSSIIKSASSVSDPSPYGASELETWIRAAQKAGTIQGEATEVDTNGDGVVTIESDFTNSSLAYSGVVGTFVSTRNLMGETSPWNSSLPLWAPESMANNQMECDGRATANAGQISLCFYPAEDQTISALFVSAADDAGNIVYKKSVHGMTEQERINNMIETAASSVPELEVWLRASQNGGYFNPLKDLREIDTDGDGIIGSYDMTNGDLMNSWSVTPLFWYITYVSQQMSPWNSRNYLWEFTGHHYNQNSCDDNARGLPGRIVLCASYDNQHALEDNFFISAADGSGTVIYHKAIQGISKRERINSLLKKLDEGLPVLEKWISAGRKAGTAEGSLIEVDTTGDGIVTDVDYSNDVLAASGIISSFVLSRSYMGEGSPLNYYQSELWSTLPSPANQEGCDNIAGQNPGRIFLCYYPAENETIQTVLVSVADENGTVFYRKIITAN